MFGFLAKSDANTLRMGDEVLRVRRSSFSQSSMTQVFGNHRQGLCKGVAGNGNETDQNPATCSQVRKEDKPSQGRCGKLQRGDLLEFSGSCGKQLRRIGIQLERLWCVEKVFTNLCLKMNRTEDDEVFALKTKCQRCHSHIESGFKYVHAEEIWRCQKCFPASDKNLRCPHDLPRDARNQAWSSAVAEAPLLCQGVHAKNW